MPREVQTNLMSVGMRIRKSMSDSAFKQSQAHSKANYNNNGGSTVDFGKPILTSNLSSSRLTPYSETIQRDPFAAFRAKGKADHEAIQARLATEAAAAKVLNNVPGQATLKRARDDDVATVVDENELLRETSFGSIATDVDPNWEFTDPQWLCTQESLMDENQHQMSE